MTRRVEITLGCASGGFAAGMVIYLLWAITASHFGRQPPPGIQLLLISLATALIAAAIGHQLAKRISPVRPAVLRYGVVRVFLIAIGPLMVAGLALHTLIVG